LTDKQKHEYEFSKIFLNEIKKRKTNKWIGGIKDNIHRNLKFIN
jgi:hypothetical protein